MTDLIFACLALDPPSVRQALFLADSLRRWGGELAAAPFWLLVPQGDKACLSGSLEMIDAFQVSAIEITTDPQAREFPFARKVLAVAAAEQLAA